jgi:hypothetical protein
MIARKLLVSSLRLTQAKTIVWSGDCTTTAYIGQPSFVERQKEVKRENVLVAT